MEETTRAFAVLAALVLVLAPVTNGVLDEAAKTAERVFLDPADYDRQPPEDPPNATPPEDIPPGNRTFNGSAGARPSCEIVTKPAVGWNHEPVDSSPFAGSTNRSTDPTSLDFTVNDTHIGIGVALRITNLTGQLSASVYQDDADSAPFQYSHQALSSEQPTDVNETSTIPHDELSNGDWTAELNFRSANYDRLQYVVVRASCAGGSG